MEKKRVNINIGVLGHVDSGKTSLVKVLSSQGSTAAFDKNPQSKERGITIDLGFSTFMLSKVYDGEDVEVQFTLVDCPGHASLIKTIIGGAQIIDLMILVVDVTKGVQTQTAECLIIGEICCDKMIVVLNKIDLIEESKRQSAIEKMKHRLGKTLEKTKFKGCPIIPVAASPNADESQPAIGVNELKDLLSSSVDIPVRNPQGPFVFSVDHCFQIKGQGTVMTGTVIQGSVDVNSTIEIPALKVQKKVKSMQMFRKPTLVAIQGDRVGICVTQFDSKLLERGVVCSPGHLVPSYAVVIPAHRINYFKPEIKTGSKFHITVVHETVLAKLTFFSSSASMFNFDNEYCYEDVFTDDQSKSTFCLIEFDHPIVCGLDSLILASKLDTDVHSNSCRLAFYGNAVHVFTFVEYKKELERLKVFKIKFKEGAVERAVNEGQVIVKNLFKKETNIDIFSGLKVVFSSGELGRIGGSFGQSGKTKVDLNPNQEMSPSLRSYLGKGKKDAPTPSETILVKLEFKKYIFDSNKKIIQS